MSSPRILLGWALSAPETRTFHLQVQPPAWLGAVPSVPLLQFQPGREQNLLLRHRDLWARKHSGVWGPLLDLRDAYRARLERLLVAGHLAPGSLWAQTPEGHRMSVPTGAFLACSCTPLRAHAARCHRWWAAPYLARAGWDVRVDGFRPGALRDHFEAFDGHYAVWDRDLLDLEAAGFSLLRVRQSIVQMPHLWWRIGASILKDGREVGRVWGEDHGLDFASLPALVGLRLWATQQGLALDG